MLLIDSIGFADVFIVHMFLCLVTTIKLLGIVVTGVAA